MGPEAFLGPLSECDFIHRENLSENESGVLQVHVPLKSLINENH